MYAFAEQDCFSFGDSMNVKCDTDGIHVTSYNDDKCEDEKEKETVVWGVCKEGVIVTGASLAQATLASLVLGTASYMA